MRDCTISDPYFSQTMHILRILSSTVFILTIIKDFFRLVFSPYLQKSIILSNMCVYFRFWYLFLKVTLVPPIFSHVKTMISLWTARRNMLKIIRRCSPSKDYFFNRKDFSKPSTFTCWLRMLHSATRYNTYSLEIQNTFFSQNFKRHKF